LTYDVQFLERERDDAKRESSSLRAQLQTVDSCNARFFVGDSSAAEDLQKLREHTKKLELQRDLANQRFDDANTRRSSLEGCCYLHF